MEQPSDLELSLKIKKCASPRFGYKRDGEKIIKDIFDGTLPKGWADSPARVDEPDKAKVAPGSSTVGQTGGRGLEPPYDAYDAATLRAEYQRRTGKKPRQGVTRVELIEFLEALDG